MPSLVKALYRTEALGEGECIWSLDPCSLSRERSAGTSQRHSTGSPAPDYSLPSKIRGFWSAASIAP